jgi:hypothetical protein
MDLTVPAPEDVKDRTKLDKRVDRMKCGSFTDDILKVLIFSIGDAK